VALADASRTNFFCSFRARIMTAPVLGATCSCTARFRRKAVVAWSKPVSGLHAFSVPAHSVWLRGSLGPHTLLCNLRFIWSGWGWTLPNFCFCVMTMHISRCPWAIRTKILVRFLEQKKLVLFSVYWYCLVLPPFQIISHFKYPGESKHVKLD
jgi:hypothetical protein